MSKQVRTLILAGVAVVALVALLLVLVFLLPGSGGEDASSTAVSDTSVTVLGKSTDADGKTEDEAKQGLTEEVLNVYGNGHISLYADMIAAIKENRKPYVDAEAGLRALELVLAIYKSQKTGQPVKLPLEDFSSLDMMGEFDLP